MRIACLLPAASEIVAGLGAAQEMVARSHACDRPRSLLGLPVVTSTRIKAIAPGTAIHASVEATLADALSLFAVDVESLRRLAPDLVITQVQCDVCAVSETGLRRALAGLAGPRGDGADGADGIDLISLEARDLEGIFHDIARVAQAVDRAGAGARLIGEMRHRLAELAGIAAKAPFRPEVAIIEWVEPLMGSGHWMPELVSCAGGRLLFGATGARSPWIDWARLRAADPDALMVAPCGFSLDRAVKEARGLFALPGFADLRAVREGRVAVVDGEAHVNRPGPRIVETAEILAEWLHPSLFAPRHKGLGWLPLAP